MPRAIDVHMHVPDDPTLPQPPYREQMAKYFKYAPEPWTVEKMARLYKELDIFGVIFTVNIESAHGVPSATNEYVADIVKKYPNQFIGFATVDPWAGKMAARELEQAVRHLGMRGLKLAPNVQAFFPSDRKFYPIYEKCVELDIPVILHSGHAAAGSGLPGGGGIRLKYSAPIPYVDDVAADFPELKIIMAHPAWPWQDEQLSVAVHKANVYIDLSGWSPKYFSPLLIHYCNTRIKDKVMFGSDYPFVLPDRWLKDFETMPFEESVKPKILKENAKKLLKLDL